MFLRRQGARACKHEINSFKPFSVLGKRGPAHSRRPHFHALVQAAALQPLLRQRPPVHGHLRLGADEGHELRPGPGFQSPDKAGHRRAVLRLGEDVPPGSLSRRKRGVPGPSEKLVHVVQPDRPAPEQDRRPGQRPHRAGSEQESAMADVVGRKCDESDFGGKWDYLALKLIYQCRNDAEHARLDK